MTRAWQCNGAAKLALLALCAFLPNVNSRMLQQMDALPHSNVNAAKREKLGLKDSLRYMGQHLGEELGDHLDTTYDAFAEQFEEHVTPRISQYTEDFENARKMFDEYEHSMEETMQEYVGTQYSKAATWAMVFAWMVLPVVLLLAFVFDRLSSAITLEHLLVFTNAYGCMYFTTLLILTSSNGGQEPMGVLQQSNPDAYIIFQLGVAAMYVLYALVHVGMLCSVQLLAVALMRMVTCLGIGLHYYITVWQPAMLDKPPTLGNPYFTYAMYAFAYLVNCVLPSVPIAGGDQVLAFLDDNEDKEDKQH